MVIVMNMMLMMLTCRDSKDWIDIWGTCDLESFFAEEHECICTCLLCGLL